jgi:hypothetical protein
MIEKKQLRRGMHEYRTPSGFTVLEIDFFADDEKDPLKDGGKWIREARQGSPDQRLFAREVLRDWSSAAGTPYFPEWQLYGGDEAHIQKSTGLLIGAPIIRGWDFGRRNPAVIWAQYDPTIRRWWQLRELMLTGLSIYTFRDIVLYASGQLQYEELSETQKMWVKELGTQRQEKIDAGDTPPPALPFFRSPYPIRFIDFSGSEASHKRSEVPEEVEEITNAMILEKRGIYLTQKHNADISGGPILRDLLAPRPDGAPGFVVDPACPITAEGIGSMVSFKKPTPNDPHPEGYRKDGYYDHILEATMYALAGVVEVAEEVEAARVLGSRSQRVSEAPVDSYLTVGEGAGTVS